ncbi:hypothetical protein OUZ56_022696 [Daphnia magna]|uniref:Uncharacterized protein n=1 Tax=Daphnia magna TaxID=35525 RepID=A0ABR0AXC6_9CRUS|nr:hypothetical protein OUZ56_022696 [Daphnia magna]
MGSWEEVNIDRFRSDTVVSKRVCMLLRLIVLAIVQHQRNAMAEKKTNVGQEDSGGEMSSYQRYGNPLGPSSTCLTMTPYSSRSKMKRTRRDWHETRLKTRRSKST